MQNILNRKLFLVKVSNFHAVIIFEHGMSLKGKAMFFLYLRFVM